MPSTKRWGLDDLVFDSPAARLWTLDEAMAEAEARRRRERWYKPGLWMLWALRRKATDARLATRFARQRVVRGWDDRSLWSLDDRLAKTLGEQLVKMADIAHGHPADYPFDQWTGDLRKHGEALLTYQRQHYDARGAEWNAIYEPAQEALRWVADNLAHLWD